MSKLTKSQTFTKGVLWAGYTGYTAISSLISLPTYAAYFVIPSNRPNPRWTFSQALGNYFIRIALWYIGTTEFAIPQVTSTKHGDLIHLKPVDPRLYKGLLDDPEIQPITSAAIWVPSAPKTPLKPDQFITLHFHGGAYVTINPSMTASQNGPRILAKELGTPVLMLDYRLSCNPKSRFPAALQDAITAYKHLLEQGYSPKQILLSGDSAGGNLVLALLRHIAEHKHNDFPCPAGAMLWSPWTIMDVTNEEIDNNPNNPTDYLTAPLVVWGVREYVPKDRSPAEPYFSPAWHPFATEAKLFVHTGTSELIYYQHQELVAAFSKIMGNKVVLNETMDGNHDLFAGGSDVGWPNVQAEIVKAAHDYFRG